jgi:hypothetical protein
LAGTHRAGADAAQNRRIGAVHDGCGDIGQRPVAADDGDDTNAPLRYPTGKGHRLGRATLIGDWDHIHSPPLRVNESRAQLTRPGYHMSRTKGLERQLDQAAVRSGAGGPVNDEAKAVKPQRRSHLGPSSSLPIS